MKVEHSTTTHSAALLLLSTFIYFFEIILFELSTTMFSKAVSTVSKRQLTSYFNIRALSSTNTNTDCINVKKLGDGIASMILCRHEGKNSFSKAMLLEFNRKTEDLKKDTSVNCLILHSDVAKVFCAGADLKERLSMPDNEVFLIHIIAVML